MSTYILRDLPEPLWSKVKTRSQADGVPLRSLFLQLLEGYANHQITPGAQGTTLIVRFHDGDREEQMSDVDMVREEPLHLVIYGVDGRMLGRIARNDVKSWRIRGT